MTFNRHNTTGTDACQRLWCGQKSLCLIGLTILVSQQGCQPQGPRTYPVRGTVTYDGTLVSNGDIFFIPENTSLAPDAGKIDQGQFAARAKEGTCRIEITALDVGPDTPVIMGSPIAANYIPERYNRQSTLQVEVSATEDNVYEFKLEK